METMIGVAGTKENFSAASPINYVRKDLPPALIIHGDADQTIPVGLAVEFYKALQGKPGRQANSLSIPSAAIARFY
jgi:dipeptidyl aminopeptidase/acylaminoacyl peptidase